VRARRLSRAQEYSDHGTFVCFVKLRAEIRRRLVRAEVLSSENDARLFSSMRDAVSRFVVDGTQ